MIASGVKLIQIGGKVTKYKLKILYVKFNKVDYVSTEKKIEKGKFIGRE